MDNIIVAGVGGSAIVFAVVAFAKYAFGWKDKQAAILAVVTGLVLGIMNYVIQTYPEVKPWYENIIVGIMLGLVASGFYSVQKNIRK